MYKGDHKEKMTQMKKKRKEITRRVALQMRELRESFGFKIVQMAKYFNVSPTSWHRYESGERVPGIVVLHKLLEDHDISVDWLYFDHGPRKASEKGGGKALKALEQRNAELERKLEAAGHGEAETRALRFLKQYEANVGPFPDPDQFKPDMLGLLDGMSKNRQVYHEMMLAFEKVRKKD